MERLTEEEKKKRKQAAQRRYEANNYRINIVFPAGTKERIEALGAVPTAFIREAVENALTAAERFRK